MVDLNDRPFIYFRIRGHGEMNFDLTEYLESRKEVINSALREYLLRGEEENSLYDSVFYTIFPGGKRLRPILCLAASEVVCGSYTNVLPAACAIEMIHTYSIIHDDLPSMDNDDMRRGKLANHRVFGEGPAILAGDALLTDAFGLMAEKLPEAGVPPELTLSAISVISRSAGSKGMVLGQFLDLKMEGEKKLSPENIRDSYMMKTAMLFSASVLCGAIIAGAGNRELEKLRSYAEKLGVAFQIMDDVLDSSGDGTTHPDNQEKAKKQNYLSFAGHQNSIAKVRELTDQAMEELLDFEKEPNPLREIAVFLREREQ